MAQQLAQQLVLDDNDDDDAVGDALGDAGWPGGRLRQLHALCAALAAAAASDDDDRPLDDVTSQRLLDWLGQQLRRLQQQQQQPEYHAALLQLLLACSTAGCLRRCRLPLPLADQLIACAGLSDVVGGGGGGSPTGSEQTRAGLACVRSLLSHVPSSAEVLCSRGILEGVVNRIRTFREPSVSWELKLADVDILDRVLRALPALAPKVYRDLDGFVYLMEVIDLIMSDCRPPRPLAQQEQLLVSLVLRVLASLAANNDKENLTPDEDAHFLRLVSLVHDLLLLPGCPERRPLLEAACLDALVTVPLVAFEELTTPLDPQSVDAAATAATCCRFDGRNLAAVNCLVDHLRHCLRDEASDSRVGACLTVLTEAAMSQRTVRRFLRSLILPRQQQQQQPTTSDTEDESVTETEANCLLSDLCRLVGGGGGGGGGGCLARQAGQLLFVLCKENPARVVRHTGLTHFPSLVHSLQISSQSSHAATSKEFYSSDSSDDDALDPEVTAQQQAASAAATATAAAACSHSRAAASMELDSRSVVAKEIGRLGLH